MAGIVGGVCIASKKKLLSCICLFSFLLYTRKMNPKNKIQESYLFTCNIDKVIELVVVKYPWNKKQFDTIVYGFYASCGVCGSCGGDKGNIQEGHIWDVKNPSDRN